MADYNGSRWLEKVMKFGERYGEKQRLQLIEHKPLTKRQARTMLDNFKKNYPQHAETIERLGMTVMTTQLKRTKQKKERHSAMHRKMTESCGKEAVVAHDDDAGVIDAIQNLSDQHFALGSKVFAYVGNELPQQTSTPFNFKTAIHASPSQFLSSAIDLLNFKREGYEDDSNIVSFPFGLSNFFTSSDVVKMMRSPIEYCHSLFSKQDDAMLTYLKKWRYRYRPNEAELADFRERIMDGIVYRAILLCLLSLDRDKWGATYAGGYFSQLKVRMLRAEAAERTLRRVNDELAEVCKQHHVSAVDFATATAPTPSVLRRVKRKRIGDILQMGKKKKQKQSKKGK